MKKGLLFITSLLIPALLTSCGDKGNTHTETIKVDGVSLNESSKTLIEDETFTLIASLSPSDADNQNITWSVDQDDDFVSINATSGKEVTVTALKEGSATVTATTEDGGFTSSCAFSVTKKEVLTAKAFVFDTHGLISLVEEKVDGEFVEVTDTGVEEGDFYYSFLLDTDIRVKLEKKDNITPLGLTVNSEFNYDINEDGYVTFRSVLGDYDFFSINVRFKDDTPVTGDYRLEINNPSTNLEVTLYSDKNKSQKVDSANLGDVVYVDVTALNEDYYAESVTITRITNELGYKVTSDASYDNEAKMFYFTVSSAYPYDSDKPKNTITIIEGNNALLKGTGLPGTYLSIWITTSSTQFLEFDDNKTTIVESNGKISRYSGDKLIRNDKVKSFTDSTIYTESYHDLLYGKNYLFTNDSGDNGFYPPFGSNYDLLFIKKEKDDDPVSDYKVRGEKFVVNDITYVLLRIYHNDSQYLSFLLDYTNKKVTTDVTFKFLYGNEITDQKVIYEVYNSDIKLLGISYEKEGGQANRIPLVSPYGVYEGSLGEFVLANDVVGVIDNTNYVAVIEDNTVTLTTSSRKIVLTLDTAKNTYEVVSDEEISAKVPDLKGKIFTNDKFWGQWDEEYIKNTKFTFNDYTSDDEIQVTFSGYSYYTATFNVTVDLDTNIITMKIILSSQPYQWITNENMTITAQLADGKMTMLKNFNNVLTFKNAVYTCPDFKL